MVDAGMRELWATGVMHNRVRMIVGSFLVKNLLQPWQDGARWFWDTLVDADLANNTLNWQWVAGSGADAAPYFRIFNPRHAGRAIRSGWGRTSRKWVPELAGYPAHSIHGPWRSRTQPAPRLNPSSTSEVARGRTGRIRATCARRDRNQTMALRFTTLDVFTDRPFGGNPLAVFCDQPELPPSAMQAIAREFNLSETVFIVPPRDPRALATLAHLHAGDGAAVRRASDHRCRAHAGGIGHRRLPASRANFALELEVGLVPINVTRRENAPPFLQLTAARLPETRGTAPSPRALARMLGLEERDVLPTGQRRKRIRAACRICSCPCAIARRSRARSRTRRVVAKRCAARGPRRRSCSAAIRNCRARTMRARMFAPELGVVEDPATGSAAAAFAGYLAAREAAATARVGGLWNRGSRWGGRACCTSRRTTSAARSRPCESAARRCG